MLGLYITVGVLAYITTGSVAMHRIFNDAEEEISDSAEDKWLFAFLSLLWPAISLGAMLMVAIDSGKLNWLGRSGKFVGRTVRALWYGIGNTLFLPFTVGNMLTRKKDPQLPEARIRTTK